MSRRARGARVDLGLVFAGVAAALAAVIGAYNLWLLYSLEREKPGLDDALAVGTPVVSAGLLALALGRLVRVERERERHRVAEEILNQRNQRLLERVREQRAALELMAGERQQAVDGMEAAIQEVTRLTAELSELKDRERRQIAAELHDRLGHTLVLLKYRLEAFQEVTLPGEWTDRVAEVNDLVCDAIRSARSLMSELSSPVFEFLPFGAAVRSLADSVFRADRTAVSVEVVGQPTLPPGERRALFLLALREVFVNIVKHANARAVKVVACCDGDCVRVDVTDDGIGFEPPDTSLAEARDWPQLGLRTIAERMTRLRGYMVVDSRPGDGSAVSLVAPADLAEAS